MNRDSVRRSGIGAAVGAAVFGGVSVYRSLLAEGAFVDYLGPVGMMTVIGGTVGGLVGPLIAQAWGRRRERRMARPREARGADGSSGVPRGTGDAGGTDPPGRTDDGGGRQPFWFTLLVGAGVGYGIGTAWGRIWVGVVLGLILSLLSRRIFA